MLVTGKRPRAPGADPREKLDRQRARNPAACAPPLPQASYQNHEPLRRRKCLVHAREARKLEGLLAQGRRTLVPLSLYFLGHRVKVELGVGVSRRKGDKREAEKSKEARKQIRNAQGRRPRGE